MVLLKLWGIHFPCFYLLVASIILGFVRYHFHLCYLWTLPNYVLNNCMGYFVCVCWGLVLDNCLSLAAQLICAWSCDCPHSQRKGLYFPSSHQLPIAPLIGSGAQGFFHIYAGVLVGLVFYRQAQLL